MYVFPLKRINISTLSKFETVPVLINVWSVVDRVNLDYVDLGNCKYCCYCLFLRCLMRFFALNRALSLPLTADRELNRASETSPGTWTGF